MACYNPLKGFILGKKDNGKQDLKVCSYSIDHLEFRNGEYIKVGDSFVSSYCDRVVRNFVEVPCGQCVGCRLQYSREWANRCMLELKYHECAYFVTFTYDDDHIPLTYYGDVVTGEVQTGYTLKKRDIQLFFKRLRKRYPDADIRYYLAGEYGDSTYRPHYHCILYGCDFFDKVYYRSSELGHKYYTSSILTRLWRNGIVVFGDVCWESCAYTARYVMKKLKGEAASVYDSFNMESPFVLMSRRPAIGRRYYESVDVFKYDYINIATDSGGLKFKPPRYYKRLFEIDDPINFNLLKERDKCFAESMAKAKLDHTSLSYIDLLAVEQRAIDRKLKVFERKDL